MNKKLFLGMFAAAGMLLATSCSNDELDVVQSGNEAQVTFSLGLEGGISTRAISDGKSADLLYYAIFDANQKLITTIANSENGLLKKESAFPNQSKNDEVTVTLAKGQEYTAVFWAQDASCNAYKVTAETDGLNVDVDYEGDNNDETRDAFFKAETFKVTGNAKIDVELKRPFAQINVGVTDADWNAAVASGVEITESKVVIKNAATSINLLDGTVSGEEEVTYDFATIPHQFTTSETLNVDTDSDGEKESFKYLSMSYILVNDENGGSSKATLESEGLQFTFSPKSGNDIFFFEGLNNVPVQRNWRTNIIGKILTGDIKFNITIDPIYDGEYNYPDYKEKKIGLNGTYYETIEEALNDANDGDVIYVGEDTYASLPSITKKVTLICEEGTVFEGKQSFNIKGSTIVGATFQSGDDKKVSYYSTINGIFKDCTFNGDLHYSYAGETVIFENCEFNGPDYAIHFDSNASGATNTKVILNNCVINSDWRVAIGAAISMFEATDCKFNVRGFINMWGKATLTNCEFNKPQYWVCSKDYTVYTDCKFDGRALTANDITIDGTIINVNGEYYSEATTADELTKAFTIAASDYSPLTVLVKDNITGDATAVQKENVNVIVEGNNYEYNGVIMIDGKSARYATTGLTIQNVNFTGDDNISADAYISLGNGTSTTRYTSNVTVKNCTFSTTATTKDVVAVKSYTGGDHNLSIIGCTANAGIHSLAQVKNVEKGLKFKGCKVYTKEGINLNSTPTFEMDECIFDVQGYAIRVGVNGSVNTVMKTFNIYNSTLKSACVGSDDAVIVFRDDAKYARLTLINTILDGTTEISGNTDSTVIEKK